MPACRLADRSDLRSFGKFEVDHLDLVAALLVETDRRADQRGNAVEFLLGAFLVDQFVVVALGIAAVDQHRDRNPVDATSLGHLGLGGA
jgi:hypothetical protein